MKIGSVSLVISENMRSAHLGPTYVLKITMIFDVKIIREQLTTKQKARVITKTFEDASGPTTDARLDWKELHVNVR